MIALSGDDLGVVEADAEEARVEPGDGAVLVVEDPDVGAACEEVGRLTSDVHGLQDVRRALE